jgi:hypothetical protein
MWSKLVSILATGFLPLRHGPSMILAEAISSRKKERHAPLDGRPDIGTASMGEDWMVIQAG